MTERNENEVQQMRQPHGDARRKILEWKRGKKFRTRQRSMELHMAFEIPRQISSLEREEKQAEIKRYLSFWLVMPSFGYRKYGFVYTNFFAVALQWKNTTAHSRRSA